MKSIYSATQIPIFQNKVYPSFQDAIQAPKGDIDLVVDPISGIIKNHRFDNNLMDYDEHYQNEQNYSLYFQDYLQKVIATVESFINYDKKKNIIEIGCGKGYFLKILRSKGYNITGYDPTYEGNAENIIKKYFGYDESQTNGDLLILRHTMEHIANPFSFLHTIAKANQYKGKIFIEVPTFDWIIDNNAFWDIFYEHCNYFNEDSFKNLFFSAQTGRLFNGQYMFIYADLADLKPNIEKSVIDESLLSISFSSSLTKWVNWLSQYADEGIAVWGAGAKGSTFVNRLDRDSKFIRCLVDISPRKYNNYIGGTGHYIMNPSDFLKHTDIKHIIVMNPNYLEEIKQQTASSDYNILSL